MVTISHRAQGRFAEVHTSASQRAYAEFLKWLVGFTEGYGSFALINHGKYTLHRFTIGQDKRDIKLLYKI